MKFKKHIAAGRAQHPKIALRTAFPPVPSLAPASRPLAGNLAPAASARCTVVDAYSASTGWHDPLAVLASFPEEQFQFGAIRMEPVPGIPRRHTPMLTREEFNAV